MTRAKAEWTEHQAGNGATYWVHRDGGLAVGPDGAGGYKVRKKAGSDWVDLGPLFPTAAAAKQSIRPQRSVDEWEVARRQPDRGANTVPAVGDRLVVVRAGTLPAPPASKLRVFIGRREIENRDDGRFAIIEWRGPPGWVEIGRFDTLEDAHAALHEPRLLQP